MKAKVQYPFLGKKIRYRTVGESKRHAYSFPRQISVELVLLSEPSVDLLHQLLIVPDSVLQHL